MFWISESRRVWRIILSNNRIFVLSHWQVIDMLCNTKFSRQLVLPVCEHTSFRLIYHKNLHALTPWSSLMQLLPLRQSLSELLNPSQK
jgi:hypothetical protein